MQLMTDIYLCRHGRTALNAAGLLRGRLDPELDLVGQCEAKNLGKLLSGVGLTRVISSPLSRAVETAAAIAGAHGLTVETDDRLADRAYGAFDGTSADDVVAQYGSLDAAPGVEPADAVVERALAVVTPLATDENTVAVISHDAVITALLDELTPSAHVPHHLHPRTGSWSLLRHDETGWQLIVSSSKDDPAGIAG